jgi:hypothetical protein
MPFLKFDIVEGRTDKQIKTMLDAAHRAVLISLGVPEHDRYQLVNEHKASRMVVEDTGLGITRTKNVVLVSVTSALPGSEAVLLQRTLPRTQGELRHRAERCDGVLRDQLGRRLELRQRRCTVHDRRTIDFGSLNFG